MMKKILGLSVFLILCSSYAETTQTVAPPVSRPRKSDAINRESSSFIGDPDSLDPLPVQRENLKEDEEPVLEDIREILDAPKKPKPKKIVEQKKEPPAAAEPPPPEVQAEVQPAPAPQPEYADDGPDLELEQKFHRIFQQFNAEPTPEQLWEAKSSGQQASIYFVQKGDTLWSISETLFADPAFWPKIWSLNREKIENPHFIYPGAQVVFYAGQGAQVPLLAVASKDEKIATETESTDVEPSDSGESALTRLSDSVKPEKIPDSIPVWRSKAYFEPRAKEVIVNLKALVRVNEPIINDILLTDNGIKSDLELEKPELLKGRCGGEHLLHTGPLASDSEFLIYEPLEVLDTDDGAIHAYRLIGKAQVVKEKRMKIISCNSVMSPDLVYVPASLVPSLRSTRQSKAATPTLIGGPNLGTQILFSNKQLAYINFGTQAADIGQTLRIKSQLTELPSGEIQVLDKYGSYAIGYIHNIEDIVEKGDEIISP